MTSSPRVKIIVPVFNSLHVVRPCIESVIRWTDLGIHTLTIVNDGSDEHTSTALQAWVSEHDGISVIENERNLGFVRSVNRGLQATDADYAVLLNSDTCVTPRWIDKIIACMEGDPNIGIASPISNFAPHMQIDMIPGFDYVEMAGLIENLVEPRYPDITTPEGFCYIISRECLNVCGYFDLMFDDGYGEESDYAMRANYFGFRTVCVDDTYIYHRGRATFGTDRRDELYDQNKGIFHSRWVNRYPDDFEEFRHRDPLADLRAAIARVAESQPESAWKR